MSTPLPDGTYDAFVVDVHDLDSGAQELELTIIAGTHKGQVLTIVSAAPLGDEIDLIGMPATMVIEDSKPSITIDR